MKNDKTNEIILNRMYAGGYLETELGHESIKATQVYTHVTTDRLREVYFRSFPRAHIDNKED